MSNNRRKRQLTWDVFSTRFRYLLGVAMLVYGTTVTAVVAPHSLPYILVAGTGLVGLSITIPLENRRKREQEDDES